MDDTSTRNNQSNITTADLAHTGERDPDQETMEEPTAEQREFARQARETSAVTAPVPRREEPRAPLFGSSEASSLRSRWERLQVGFVDEPRHSVEQADQLVAESIKRLAEGFAEERKNLEQQWGRGGSVSTEDLRLALRRYRSFFERLLSV